MLDGLIEAFPVFRMSLLLIGLPVRIVLMVGFVMVAMSSRMVVFETAAATMMIMCTLGHHLKIALGLPAAPEVLLNQITIKDHSSPMCNALHANK